MKSTIVGALILGLALGVSACSTTVHAPVDGGATGPGIGQIGATKRATGAECEGATQEAAGTCEGAVCISLNANVQKKKGVCSQECTGTCTSGSCLQVDTKSYCFRKCVTDADCIEGFVCIEGASAQEKVCLVHVTAAADAGTDFCTAKPGCVDSTSETGLVTACASAPGATRVCTCTGAPPNAGCTKIDQPAGAYCCL